MKGTHLLRLPRRHRRPDLGQTFAHKQDTVNEDAIGGTIDFEIPKQDIRAE